MAATKIKVMVLAGGPDRERPVSLNSGATVTASLAQAGYDVRQRDILPSDLSALDEFKAWGGDLIFPLLHGPWGEGGGLQRILDARGVPYVGCRAEAAELCMDKFRTKQVLMQHNLPTPPAEVLVAGQRRSVAPPVVVKPPCEGSSIDLAICRDGEQVRRARSRLHLRHPRLLVERFISGKELTVGILGAEGGKSLDALPTIHIVPATEFYDYQAKYDRDDTRYLFTLDIPEEAKREIRRVALEAARVLNCRHFGRVDIMLDEKNRPWILEINTIPGFTSHSLLPKAAAHAGITLPQLVDRLAKLALNGEA